jgi:cytochrome d ubiquinol oxidase subunit I
MKNRKTPVGATRPASNEARLRGLPPVAAQQVRGAMRALDAGDVAGAELAVFAAAVLAPTQAFVGDLHGLNTLEHQPAKIAAMEGIWQTERGVPLLLFAIPNEAERRNDYAVGIPKGASWILRKDPDAEIKGLNEFEGKHPPVKPVFFAFRIMVGVGLLMIAFAWYGSWRMRRGGELPRWLKLGLAGMTFSGWVAVISGWLVTEIGRQPWLIHGVMTTAEAASAVPAASIALTLTAYAIVYVGLMISYMVVVTQLAIKDAAGGTSPTAVPPALRQPLAT